MVFAGGLTKPPCVLLTGVLGEPATGDLTNVVHERVLGESPGKAGPAGVTPLADSAGAKTTGETGELPMGTSAWQESACSATAVVGLETVHGTE